MVCRVLSQYEGAIYIVLNSIFDEAGALRTELAEPYIAVASAWPR